MKSVAGQRRHRPDFHEQATLPKPQLPAESPILTLKLRQSPAHREISKCVRDGLSFIQSRVPRLPSALVHFELATPLDRNPWLRSGIVLDETHLIERVNKAVEQFCVTIFDIAIMSLGHKPLWLINNFVYSASQLAISILPDSSESEKRTVQRLCLERMLTLTATTECDECLETGLFEIEEVDNDAKRDSLWATERRQSAGCHQKTSMSDPMRSATLFNHFVRRSPEVIR